MTSRNHRGYGPAGVRYTLRTITEQKVSNGRMWVGTVRVERVHITAHSVPTWKKVRSRHLPVKITLLSGRYFVVYIDGKKKHHCYLSPRRKPFTLLTLRKELHQADILWGVPYPKAKNNKKKT